MEEKKFCPYCGEKLVGDVRFCGKCGKRITPLSEIAGTGGECQKYKSLLENNRSTCFDSLLYRCGDPCVYPYR